MALFAGDKMAAPDIYNPPPELAEGMRAITNSVETGEITQEEGNELIAYLHSAWMGAAVSNMVVDHLDRAIALSFPEAAQSGAANRGSAPNPGVGNAGARSKSGRVDSDEARASRRMYRTSYWSVGLTAAVGVTVLFALTDNLDMAVPIVTAAAGFLGGLVAGRIFGD